jgi:hypothetical protein
MFDITEVFIESGVFDVDDVLDTGDRRVIGEEEDWEDELEDIESREDRTLLMQFVAIGFL